MLATQVIVVFCGLIIGAALFLFIRSIRKMIRGRCCEGCEGCRHAAGCSSRDPLVDEKGERLDG